MPGVESEALEAKRLAVLAASEWIGTWKRREGGLKMKEFCDKYSVQHHQNVYREAQRIKADPAQVANIEDRSPFQILAATI